MHSCYLEVEAGLLDSGVLSGNCISFRFLHSDSFRDCRRPREPGWKLSPKFQGNPFDSLQTDGCYTVRRWFALLEREMQRKRGKMYAAEEEQAPAMLGKSAASRKSSSSALQEARTLLGARAGTSSTRPPVTPARAVTLKSDVPLRQPLDFAKVLAKLATVLGEPRSPRSLEKEFGVDMGWATRKRSTPRFTTADQKGKGSGGSAATLRERIYASVTDTLE